MGDPHPMYTPEQLAIWTYRTDAVPRCLVTDVLQMQAFIGYFQVGNYPCRSAHVVGVIVGKHDKESPPRTVYSLDDGTGVIDCIQRHNLPREREPIIGETVRCVGKIADTKWKDRRLEVDSIDILDDQMDELKHWEQVAELRPVYRQPFVIPHLPTTGPSTPKRIKSDHGAPGTSSSWTKSSVQSTPDSSPMKLRHPSKLHGRELTSNMFLIYLKDSIEQACKTLCPTSQFSLDNLLCTPKNARHDDPEATPKAGMDVARLKRYHPPQYSIEAKGTSLPRTSVNHEAQGITMWELRRIQPLALLARRIVRAEARRREERRGSKIRNKEAGMSHPQSGRKKGEDSDKKQKRLFVWGLKKLLEEGSIVIATSTWRTLMDFDLNLSHIWSTQTSSDVSAANATASSGASATIDKVTLSPRPPSEEMYLPLTPSLLSGPVLEAFKLCHQRKGKKRGILVEDVLTRLQRDSRWEYVGAWSVQTTMELLEQREQICRTGGGEWALM